MDFPPPAAAEAPAADGAAADVAALQAQLAWLQAQDYSRNRW